MVFRATATLVGKGLKKGAKKVKELERGASTRAGAAGNKGVRIEKNANVGQGYGVTDATKGSKALTRAERDKVLSTGRRRIVGGAGALAGGTSLFVNAVKKKDEDKDDSKNPIGPKLGDSFKRPREKAKADSPSKSGGRFGQGDNKTINGKANVSKEQLEETGLSLTEYMNKWNKTDKRPGGSSSANSSTKSSSESPKKVGIIKKLLFGSDGKMGGKSGIIDNKVTRAFTKRDEENLAAGLVKKQAGGMMKSKGYAGGGAVGMKKPGNEIVLPGKKSPKLSSVQENLLRQAQSYAKETGQNPAEVKRLTGMYGDLNAAKEAKMSAAKRPSTMRSGPREEKLAAAKNAMAMRGAAGRRSGGSTPRGMNMGGSAMKSKMASKGGKMGGKMAPGYKNGGTVGKKSARGVGAAKRGFGRAMR
jgi:hypothetical protein